MRYRIKEIAEKLAFKIAWMMPRWLVYYCSLRLISHAAVGKYGNTVVPELTVVDALKRWDK